MGVWLGYSLLVFLIVTAISIPYTNAFDTHINFRVIAVFTLFQNLGMNFAFYQILWFLEDGFLKSMRIFQSKKLSKFDSKELPSKDELVSKVDVNQSNNSSKEQRAVVVHVATVNPSSNT